MTLKLFGDASCPYVQRVRLLALEKNIPLRLLPLDDSMPKWFSELAKKGGADPPVLSVPGGHICDSMRIVDYLDSSYPVPHALFPKRSTVRADIREFVLTVDAFAQMGTHALRESNAFDIAEKRSTVLNEFELVMQRVETKLINRSQGPYFLGSAFSVADVALIPFLDRFRHGFPAFWDFNPFAATPRLRQLLAEAEHRRSFQESKLTRGETLDALSLVIGKKVLQAHPIVRAAPDSITDARAWVAAVMTGLPADLRVVKDGTLPRVSFNSRHVYDSTNAMLFLLEAHTQGDSLLPTSPLDQSRAMHIVREADDLISAMTASKGKLPDIESCAMTLEQLIVGPFALGKQRTYADAVLAPVCGQLYHCLKFRGVTGLGTMPKLVALHQQLYSDPAVKNAVEAVCPHSCW